MDVIKRIDEFVNSLDKDTKIGLIHDTDPDGICSGVLFNKAVERIRYRGVDFRIKQKHNDVGLTRETLDEIKSLKPDWVVVTDKAVDSDPVMFHEAEKYCKFLIFDHHRILADLNSEQTIFVKSQYINPKIDGSLYPTTKLVYDLLSKHVDLTDLDWIAAVGVISDMAQIQWTDFLDTVFAKYNVAKGTNYFDSSIGKVSGLISTADTCGKSDESFEVLNSAKEYLDVVKSKLREYQQQVQSEIDRILDEFNEKSEYFPEKQLYYYEISSPFMLNSMISTILSMKEWSMSFIVLQQVDEYCNISARRQDKSVAMNEILGKAVDGLKNANGGGHRPAAGGKFLAKDKDTVKKRILKMLS